MEHCHSCGASLVTSVLPEHVEVFGSMRVIVRDSVLLHRCPECGDEMTEIPGSQQLYRAVALARVMLPVQMSAKDIRFLRSVFDMTQDAFAKEIGLDSAETISRWENGVRGVGGFTEKGLRHAVFAKLYKEVPAAEFDPEDINRMIIRQRNDDDPLPTLAATRVIIKRDHHREQSWDTDLPLAA